MQTRLSDNMITDQRDPSAAESLSQLSYPWRYVIA